MLDGPHYNSLAGYMLLKQKLKAREDNKKSPEWRIWLTFRNRFLKRHKKKHGDLKCFFCNKENLIANHHGNNARKSRLATIDHYHPLSKGGSKYNESNLRVSCLSCNQRKADKIIK